VKGIVDLGGQVPPASPRRRALVSLLRALACIAIVAFGAPPVAADDVQFWPTFSVYTPTTDGWKASVEVQGRWTDDLETYNRTVYRLNGGRSVTPRLELLGGWELTAPSSSAVGREQRLWQQAEYTVRSGRWTVSNRVRLEQRFLAGVDEVASRLRCRFRLQHSVGGSKWTIGASEELWLHLTTVELAGQRGVDQNRLAVTAFRAVTPHLSIEPGYLYIDANVPAPRRNRGAHVATLQVTARF
jgi:hypothetical protein